MRVQAIRVLGERLPMTLVEIVTDDGTIGIGGADAPASALRPIIEGPPWNFARIVLSHDPTDIPELNARMERAAFGQSGLVAHAQAAIDMALWDLQGKRSGVPVWRLLGATKPARVLAYASATAFDVSNGLTEPLPFKQTRKLIEEAMARIVEGFQAIKFGRGDHFNSTDLERIAAIRLAIGPDVRFMIDFGGPDYFNAGVSPSTAAKIATALEPYNIFFLEEPLPPHDFDGFSELKRRSPIPIATGEMLCRNWEFNRLIDAGSIDVIQPDAYRIGVSATLAIARQAAEAGIECVPHSPWSALAVAAHVQVLGSLFENAMIEYPSPSLYTDTERHGKLIRLATCELVDTPMLAQNGFLEASQAPGLGLGQFRYDVIEQMESLAVQGLER